MGIRTYMIVTAAALSVATAACNSFVRVAGAKSESSPPSPPLSASAPSPTPLAQQVCAGIEFVDSNGQAATGTASCGDTVADCRVDGEIGCLTTTTFPAVLIPAASDVRAGRLIAGVRGTLRPWCANGARLATLDFGPSPYRTIATFQDFDATLSPGGFALSDGMSLTLQGSCGPAPVGHQDGQIYYAKNVVGDTLQFALTPGGAAIEIQYFFSPQGSFSCDRRVLQGPDGVAQLTESIVDGLAPAGQAPVDAPPGLAGRVCDGSDWTDVSLSAAGDVTRCVSEADECMFRNERTGQTWSEALPTNTMNGYALCDALTFGGFSDWRLPTVKEALTLYVDGAFVHAAGIWIEGKIPTSTSLGNGWPLTVNPWTGEVTRAMSLGLDVACVRSK